MGTWEEAQMWNSSVRGEADRKDHTYPRSQDVSAMFALLLCDANPAKQTTPDL